VYVELSESGHVEQAINAVHGKEIEGRVLNVVR